MFYFQYEIIAHSGEGYDFPMCKSDSAPKNNKERLNVIKVSKIDIYIYI